jgi:Glycosyl transferase family 2
MTTPAVSILLAVRNGAKTLPLALRSLIAQTEEGWELLVYDDGSSDGTIELLERWTSEDDRVRVFHSFQSRGLGARLNELIEAARAPFIARMDADDVAYPERLRRQCEFLDAHRDIDLVGSSMAIFRDDGSLCGKRFAPRTHHEIAGLPLRGIRVFHPTWMGRAEWFKLYRYKPGAMLSQDQELLFRAMPASRYANISEILLGYREDRVSISRSLRARKEMIRGITPIALERGHPVQAFLHVAGHIAKAGLDSIAVATGAHQRLTRQRAGPISPEERAEWEHVWRALQSPDGAYVGVGSRTTDR